MISFLYSNHPFVPLYRWWHITTYVHVWWLCRSNLYH